MSSNLTPQQPELFSHSELPDGGEILLPEEKQRELYPLTTVEKNQARLAQAIFLLGHNAPRSFICKALGIGWHTLSRVAEKHGDKIADVKKRSAAKLAMFVELGVEQMLEDLQAGRLDPDKLPVSVAIAADKLQVLTGEASVIVGQAGNGSGSKLTADTLRERLNKAKVVDAEVTDVPTGSLAGNLVQTRAIAAGGSLEAGAADTQSIN